MNQSPVEKDERDASRLSLLATLLDIATELSSILDLDLLLGRMSQLLERVVEHELFALLLVDEERQQFVWQSGVGYADVARRKFNRFSVNQGIAGRAYQTRKSVLVGDVSADPDYVAAQTASGKAPVCVLAVPLIFQHRVLGVLVLESTVRDYFTTEHLQVVSALARQLAIAIENAQLYEARNRDALVKQLLNEVGKEIASILDLDELIAKIGVLTKKLIDYEVFVVGLLNSAANEIELKVGLGMSEETRRRFHFIPVGNGVMSRAIIERRPVAIDDLRDHPTLIPVFTDEGKELRSMLAVPLVYKHRVSGVLAMQSAELGFFRQEHIQAAVTLGSQVAAAIENAKLFRELYSREQKLENDFQIARSMQLSMLPRSMPQCPGLEFAAKYIPADDLAGDLYDFIQLDENRIGFLLGDVSGKGVSAALVMAAARGALRFAAHSSSDPATVLFTTNRQLVRGIKNRFYVATFYGVIDVRERWFLWSNAGHHPPFRISANNTVSRLSVGGTVLGLFDNARYQKQRSELESGDIYVFYTDGIIEAEDRNGREFGASRLVETIIANRERPARVIRDTILKRLRRHTPGVVPHDDITLVILKCA